MKVPERYPFILRTDKIIYMVQQGLQAVYKLKFPIYLKHSIKLLFSNEFYAIIISITMWESEWFYWLPKNITGLLKQYTYQFNLIFNRVFRNEA